MTSKNDLANAPAGRQTDAPSESGPSSFLMGWAMVGGIGLLMLLGYVFR